MASKRRVAIWPGVLLLLPLFAQAPAPGTVAMTAAAASTTPVCPIQPDPPLNTLPSYAQSGSPQPIQYRTAFGPEQSGYPQLQSDGDYHMDMTPNDSSLLSDGAVSNTFLRPEEVPNQPITSGATNDWAPSPYPNVPTSGENIIIRGPWIQDPHGNNWMELHPIFGWCPWSGSDWTANYSDFDNNPPQGVTGISQTPTSWSVGQTQTYKVTVLNDGAQTWASSGTNPIRLHVHFKNSGNTSVTDQAFSLPSDLTPGHAATMSLSVTAPGSGGTYTIEYQMVKEGTGGFPFNLVADLSNVTVSGTTGTNDFSVSASPSSLTLAPGGSGTSTIGTAVTSGSAQTVSLSATGLPSGATGSFSPSSVTAGSSSTMTITTSSSTPSGTYTVTVTGIGTSATRSTSVTLTVNPLSSSSSPQLVQNAASNSFSVTFPAATTVGDLLVLSASVYTGATRPITAVSDGKNTWSKTGGWDTSGHFSDGEMWYAPNAASVTTITVTTSASSVALEAQEFSGVVPTNPLDMSTGTSSTGTSASSGSVTPSGSDLMVGFIAGHSNIQPITVSAAGYTTQPQVNSTSGGTVSVITGYNALISPSTQSFTGTFGSPMYWAGGIAGFKAASPSPTGSDFSISANPTSLSLSQGSGGTSAISTAAIGSGGTVSLAVGSNLPSGATASLDQSTVTAGSGATLTVTTSASAATGNYSVTVTGTEGTATHSTSVSVAITTPTASDFSISANPTSLSLSQGSGGTSAISTAAIGSGGTVSLAVGSDLPSGATASLDQSSVTAGSGATLTVNTSASAATGTYTVTVTGTEGTATHSTSVSVAITTPTASSTPQLVQAVGASESSSASSLTASFPTATTAGDLLVVSASVYTGVTNPITSVTDNAGDVWQRVGAFAVSGHYSDGEIWYAPNAFSVTSITVHTASATEIAMEMEDFSGIVTTSPLDGSTGTSNTGTSATAGSVTPVGTNDLVIGFVAGHSNAQTMTVSDSSYTAQPQQTSSGGGSAIASVVTGYQVLSSAVAVSFSGSFSSTMYWAAGVACFRAAS